MIESLILYALTVYFAFHLASRADLLSTLRAWVLRKLPGWLTYPLGCAFCFTWWSGWVLWFVGAVPLNVVTLAAAPVVNMVLDLVVAALVRANEPPLAKREASEADMRAAIVNAAKREQEWRDNFDRHIGANTPFNPLDHEQTK